ncbi:MAG: hypothetical protein M1822_004401 [Bathelium mastoideum]|nr:MAG: hypothetical protein M1822_004401 [Bathelium mastoideum]
MAVDEGTPETRTDETVASERHEDETGPKSNVSSGYYGLAEFISTTPEVAVFRKFGLLNMMNLLRLQAELQDMEQQFADVWMEDRDCDDPIRKLYRFDFRLMRKNADGGDSIQHDLLVEIGNKLKEYNSALQAVMALQQASPPNKLNLKSFRFWLENETMGNGFLSGIEAAIWREANDEDFATVTSPSGGPDKFTEFLSGNFLSIYNALIGRHSTSERKHIDETFRLYDPMKLQRVGDGIVAALSAILPTIAILVLYFVSKMIVRIGLIIVFTTVFAVSLALFTEAKKIEIFSATAAFAAVEVVFVGSTSVGGT